jgi:hypothetical protein
MSRRITKKIEGKLFWGAFAGLLRRTTKAQGSAPANRYVGHDKNTVLRHHTKPWTWRLP